MKRGLNARCIDGIADASRLAAITCHFNFAGFKQPVANLKAFMLYMAACNVPVYGVEAHLADQDPVTKDVPGWKQIVIDDRHILWQKEALLNIAEKMVPASYDQIVWIDADVEFQYPDWPQRTAFALQKAKMVQPFEVACWWGKDKEFIRDVPSFIRASRLGRSGHVGFALAAQREMWKACGGLYAHAILGSGDSALGAAALQLAPLPSVPGWNARCVALEVPDTYNLYTVWHRKLKDWLQGSLAYTAGGIHHAWHGDLEHRRYTDRWQWMRGFNAKREVRLNADGVLEWTRFADVERIANVKAYFRDRREDG